MVSKQFHPDIAAEYNIIHFYICFWNHHNIFILQNDKTVWSVSKTYLSLCNVKNNMFEVKKKLLVFI